ncbi:hypothetical protein M0805_009129 [Coniferiporia weirii]|nr:hypothetical protein M0805_009129 [Coniferiporia weirii]
MFYVIGLGLCDERDITVRSLELRSMPSKVNPEYTSILMVQKERLKEFYGRAVILADREMVELESDEILHGGADKEDVSLLVVGDPFGATTHTDMTLHVCALSQYPDTCRTQRVDY